MEKKGNNFLILQYLLPTHDREKADVEAVKKLSELGLDESNNDDRAYAWLLLLKIYPECHSEWEQKKRELTQQYFQFVKDAGMEDWHNKTIPNQVIRSELECKDQSTMAIIHGDIVRTGRLIFTLAPRPIEGAKQEDEEDSLFHYAGHLRRLERILYLFSYLSGEMKYMQGFNELLTPLYYAMVQANLIFSGNFEQIEAISYYCLQSLLMGTELQLLYQTGDSSSIILHNLEFFTQLMKKHLPKLYQKLESVQAHPLFYCYRWFNLLFSQEYEMPSILRIWDSLFSHFDNLLDYAYYVGVGHMKYCETHIESKNSGEILGYLQHLSDDIRDVKPILEEAKYFWDLDRNKTAAPEGFFKKIFKSRKP